MSDRIQFRIEAPSRGIGRPLAQQLWVQGWCRQPDGIAPKQVHVQVGNSAHSCGLAPRPDLIQKFPAAHLDPKGTYGFAADIRVGLGWKLLRFKAQWPDGTEREFAKRLVRIHGSVRAFKSENPQTVKYLIYRNAAFGDTLMAALFVANLRDQGLDVVFWDDRASVREQVDVPIWEMRELRVAWHFSYAPEDRWDGRTMMAKALANFSAWSGLKNLAQIRRMVPVKYVDEPDVAPTDVAICSSTGNWATYRNWPYFPELKSLLTAHGIRWVDISELRDNRCLNQVKKSRLYLGLDTGVSHLVSSVVNSGLIIQSGFSNIHYWSSYGYQTIEHDVYCRNCFLRQGCPNEHRCMRDILPAEVLARIKKLLGLT